MTLLLGLPCWFTGNAYSGMVLEWLLACVCAWIPGLV